MNVKPRTAVCELDAAVRACGPCVGDVLEAVSGIDGGTVGEFVRGAMATAES